MTCGTTSTLPDTILSDCLELLLRAVQNTRPASDWKCFQSLSNVAVGLPTDLRHPHHAYYPLLSLHCYCFLKSSAWNSIYVCTKTTTQTAMRSRLQRWRLRMLVLTFSSGNREPCLCQSLRFYCCVLVPETTASFIGACRRLESFESEASSPSLPTIIHALLVSGKNSLKALREEAVAVLYSRDYDPRRLPGALASEELYLTDHRICRQQISS